ncbi:MAG: carboxypeptidase-like regulatory domain-containing protein [Bryobacteraceae bacterium]|nr:carboxypeptidase-like regulatory domain-containing protein [Bryobacteraceae bacterium]
MAAYSEEEWTALVAKGRVCAYTTGESSRRTVLAAALLTTISTLTAQAQPLRIVVVDATGAPVGKAAVNVVTADRKSQRGETDDAGVLEFAWLPMGKCEVTVERAGFRKWLTKLPAPTGRVDAVLEVGGATMGVYIADVVPEVAPVTARKQRRFR